MFKALLLIVPLLLAAEPSTAEDPKQVVDALTAPNPAANRWAFGEVARVARERPATAVATLNDGLVAQVGTNRESVPLRNVCSALGMLGSTQAVPAVLDRFAAEPQPANRVVLLHGLGKLLRSPSADLSINQSRVTSVLEGVLSDRTASCHLVHAAASAAASMGPAGFDLLVRTKGKSSALSDVWYTAIGETGDPRAVGHLRAVAAATAETSDGRKVQAMNALRTLFALSRGPIPETERAACIQVLYTYVNPQTSDQLFSVALGALMQIAPKDDPIVQTAIAQALQSGRPDRQQAILDKTQEHQLVLSDETLAMIKQLAQSGDPSIRDSAESALSVQKLLRMEE